MIRVLLIIGLIAGVTWYLFSLIKNVAGGGNRRADSGHFDMAQDPVCGKYVPRDTAITRNVGSIITYYCSQECARVDTIRESN